MGWPLTLSLRTVSSLDKLYEDSGFVGVDSETESGKGEFVEALEGPTCLLQ